MYGNWFEFIAIQGIQARAAFFVIMVPLKVVSKLFRFNDEQLPASLRSQRILNKARIPEISRYITENPDEYILSSLCATVDDEVQFEAIGNTEGSKFIGKLRIPMTSTVLINDGQHRRAAIEEAIRERAYLGDETISVVLFVDKGLKRSQQMFADLNIHAIRPTKSLTLLYNHRDARTEVTKKIIENIPIFKYFTDFEKTSISNRSLKLFTFSSLHQATMELIGKIGKQKTSKKQIEKAIGFWQEVIINMPDWQKVESREVSSAELRQDYIHSHGITLQALGIVGANLLKNYPNDWKILLKKLQDIDWSRSNLPLWDGRALVTGKINKSRNNIILVSNLIFTHMQIPLSAEAQRIEDIHLLSKQTNITDKAS